METRLSSRFVLPPDVALAVYVVGLPLVIFVMLYKRRRNLFGPDSDENLRKYGFLYDGYGPVAWWWETEELLRKLLLTAVAVLLDPGSPLQASARGAVLWSGCLECTSTILLL
jgi:hypothetical protein